MGSNLRLYWSDHFQIFNKYKLHLWNKIAFILFRINKEVKKCERKIQIYGKIKDHIFSNTLEQTKLDRLYPKTE